MQIALTLTEGIGDITIRSMLTYFGSLEEIFKLKKNVLKKVPGIGPRTAESIVKFSEHKRVEEEIRFIEKNNIKPLFITDKDFPQRLKNLNDAPVLLYQKGEMDLNPDKTVGIVGTRLATPYGKEFIADLINGIHGFGCTIISGMAFGADIQAHRKAIEFDLPTIGVMAHGLDRIYPYQHRKTAEEMYKNGGLLTEFPSKTNPDRENFPKRNRIVAGMSDVLVVIETAMKGGAMITADIADSYNRDVMALPGRVNDAFSSGCNFLIKQNKAAMICSPDDLIKLMNWDVKVKAQKQVGNLFDLNEEDRAVVNIVGEKGRATMDDLCVATGQDSGQLSLRLLDLEFRNLIRTLPGKLIELK